MTTEIARPSARPTHYAPSVKLAPASAIAPTVRRKPVPAVSKEHPFSEAPEGLSTDDWDEVSEDDMTPSITVTTPHAAVSEWDDVDDAWGEEAPLATVVTPVVAAPLSGDDEDDDEVDDWDDSPAPQEVAASLASVQPVKVSPAVVEVAPVEAPQVAVVEPVQVAVEVVAPVVSVAPVAPPVAPVKVSPVKVVKTVKAPAGSGQREVKRHRPLKSARLTARDLALLEIAAQHRTTSAAAVILHLVKHGSEYANMVNGQGETVRLTETALLGRMRILAKHGFVRLFYPAQRGKAVIFSTASGIALTSYAGLALPVTATSSANLETSLAHALLIAFYIASTGPEVIGVPDHLIHRQVAIAREANPDWKPQWEAGMDPLWDSAHLAVGDKYAGIHEPDITFVALTGDRAGERVEFVEIECSPRSEGYVNLLMKFAKQPVPLVYAAACTQPGINDRNAQHIVNKVSAALAQVPFTDGVSRRVELAPMRWATSDPRKVEAA